MENENLLEETNNVYEILSSTSYYKALLDDPSVHNIERIMLEDTERGLLDRSELKKITLFNNQYIIRELFLKLYDPNRSKKPEFSRQNLSLMKGVEYQYNQMLFWNKRNLPSPKVLDYMPKRCSEEIPAALLMEYWGGTTHDMDIIVVDNELASKGEDQRDPFLQEERRNKIPEEIKKLERIRGSIIRSCLETINEFYVNGTYYFKYPEDDFDKNLFVFEPDSPETYYLEKAEHYLERIILWNLIKQGLTKEEVHRDISKWNDYIRTAKNEFEELSSFIIQPLTNESLFGYAQGDEYLHHFQYHEFGDELKSGIFDADHAMLAREEWGKAKLLLCPILGLDYPSVSDYFVHSLETEIKMLEEIKREQLFGNDIDNIEKRLMDFDLVALYESLRFIGKKAQNELVNKEYYDSFLEKIVPYDNYLISEKPLFVSFKSYETNIAIATIRRRLKERFSRMLNGNVPYGLTDIEKGNIEKLYDLYEKYGVTSKYLRADF